MSKMLTLEQVRATLKAYPWNPLVGLIERDNCEWAYNASPEISLRGNVRALL